MGAYYHANKRVAVPTGPGSEYARLSSAALRERRRNAVHAAYGSKCACCGESNPAFLTVDHVGEDGAEHRRAIKQTAAAGIYTWLIEQGFPDGFQLLCFNCNCARSLRGDGVCPHMHSIDPAIAQKQFDEFKRQAIISNGRRLTAERVDLIQSLLLDGFNGREVARALGVHEATVSTVRNGKHPLQKKGG